MIIILCTLFSVLVASLLFIGVHCNSATVIRGVRVIFSGIAAAAVVIIGASASAIGKQLLGCPTEEYQDAAVMVSTGVSACSSIF